MTTDTRRQSMRKALEPVMLELGTRLPNLVGLGADGRSFFGPFADRFPERFVDVGVAEGNLIAVASGLARAGKRVFVGSIASFLIRRAYDHIRNDVCDPNLPITLVGIGGGFSYGVLGPTHHICEDFAILGVMPNIALMNPADAYEAGWALRAAAEMNGPCYIRLGAREDPLVHAESRSGIGPAGQPVVLRDGTDALIVATGIAVHESLVAARALDARGIHVTVASVGCLRPSAPDAIAALARDHRAVIVVEEHSNVGGLGALVANALSDAGVSVPLARLAADARHPPVGTREDLLHYFELDASAIESRALGLLGA